MMMKLDTSDGAKRIINMNNGTWVVGWIEGIMTYIHPLSPEPMFLMMSKVENGGPVTYFDRSKNEYVSLPETVTAAIVVKNYDTGAVEHLTVFSHSITFSLTSWVLFAKEGILHSFGEYEKMHYSAQEKQNGYSQEGLGHTRY